LSHTEKRGKQEAFTITRDHNNDQPAKNNI
jgi:hypothetical protein